MDELSEELPVLPLAGLNGELLVLPLVEMVEELFVMLLPGDDRKHSVLPMVETEVDPSLLLSLPLALEPPVLQLVELGWELPVLAWVDVFGGLQMGGEHFGLSWVEMEKHFPFEEQYMGKVFFAFVSVDLVETFLVLFLVIEVCFSLFSLFVETFSDGLQLHNDQGYFLLLVIQTEQILKIIATVCR